MMNTHKLDRTKHPIIGRIQDIFELSLMVLLFTAIFWLFCTMIVEGSYAEAADVIELENEHTVTLPIAMNGLNQNYLHMQKG